MVTTTSGGSARRNFAVSSMCCSRRRARGRISTRPMTARSPIGTLLCSPSSAICAPPTPLNCTLPAVSRLSARISPAPSTSPDGSPAISATLKGRSLFVMTEADKEHALVIGGGGHRFRVDDQRSPGLDCNSGQACRNGIFDGCHAHGGKIHPAILLRLGCFHQDTAPGVRSLRHAGK